MKHIHCISFLIFGHILIVAQGSHPHTPTPPPYGHPSPTPQYGVHGYGARSYGYTPRPPPYAAPRPYYPTSPAPGYGAPTPSYAVPGHGHAKPHGSEYGPPVCVKNATHHTYCLEDYDYPSYEIQHAVEYHYAAVASLYKDVLANTENSIDNLKNIEEEETFVCPAEIGYLRPLRALNDRGQWRIIVNGVQAHYETLSQTARVETCLYPGNPCPIVPECYITKCVQKFIYHRFIVYDPFDYYFPFAIETFKLPSSCACYNAAFVEGPQPPQHPH